MLFLARFPSPAELPALLLCYSPFILLLVLFARDLWRSRRAATSNVKRRFWRKKYTLRALGRTARLLGK